MDFQMFNSAARKELRGVLVAPGILDIIGKISGDRTLSLSTAVHLLKIDAFLALSVMLWITSL
jgi:hypothetical protein